MQRQRGELVPIAEALADLPGPVKALRRDRPPQRGFTLADQIDRLVGASEATPDRGFLARLMALCSLPRTNPGNRKEYVRRNGPYKLGMTAGIDNKLPYGNLPRLLLAWVCTEAVRTQSRELVLGSSLSDFMGKLGMAPVGGGPTGARTRLRNQMRRLFQCHIQLAYEDKQVSVSVNSPIASGTGFWWSERTPGGPGLWDSKIELGENFFEEIIRHPVPLDMNILKALKRSSLGLDLYLWVAYRTFGRRAPLRLTWRHLYRQFGVDLSKASDKETIKFFRRRALRELKKIKLAWPGLNYTTAPGVLILLPSTPTIAPVAASPRLAQ